MLRAATTIATIVVVPEAIVPASIVAAFTVVAGAVASVVRTAVAPIATVVLVPLQVSTTLPLLVVTRRVNATMKSRREGRKPRVGWDKLTGPQHHIGGG
jgi:hypothetical protein